MRRIHGAIRPLSFGASFVASIAMALPGPLFAEEPSAVSSGAHVRVFTGSEVSGQGFTMTALETTGSVAHDKRTATFDLNGHAVRVSRPGATLEGTVQTLDDTTLVLEGSGEGRPIVIPREAITGLDVRRRESKKHVGVLLGALAGGAIGYAVSAATSGPGCQGGETGLAHLCSLESGVKAGGAIVGVLGGALLGAIVAPGEKWQRNVPLERVRVSLGPTSGRGLGISVSLGFGSRP